MATVFFYILILLLSTFFVYISDKGKGLLERRFFLTLAFLLVFIPPAIRYDIGTDFLSYKKIYENIDLYTNLEPGFYIINSILDYFNADSQWPFVIYSLIFTIAIFSSYPLKKAWSLHFAIMTLLWFSSFNIVRQVLSIAICLYALSYFFNKKYISFFLISLLATTFHTSALFIAFIGAVSLIPLKKQLKLIILPNVFVILIILSYLLITLITTYIQEILTLIGLSKYLLYFGSNHFSDNNIGTGLGALVRLLFCLYIIISSKSILKVNKDFWIVILLTFFYAIGTILASNIIIFGRMQIIFVAGPIIASYVLLETSENRKLNRYLVSIFFLFLFLSFIKESIGYKTAYSDPKLNPYKTIFSRPI